MVDRRDFLALAGALAAGRALSRVGGDTLDTRKPAPQGLEYLARITAIPLPRTLLVGDSAIDVETARAAGASFCGALWGFFPERLLRADPERTVARPLDLLAVAGTEG